MTIAQSLVLGLVCCVTLTSATRLPYARAATAGSVTLKQAERREYVAAAKDRRAHIVAAIVGADGNVVTGTATLGAMNAIQIFTYILYARFALSWFPQLPRQFPVLRPINTVTEPYLRIFRQVIPPIGGFDLSALPAIFLLDILSQTFAAVGDSRTAPSKVGVWSNRRQKELEARLSKAGLDFNGKPRARSTQL